MLFALTLLRVCLPFLSKRLVTCCRRLRPLSRDLAKWDLPLLSLHWRAPSTIPAHVATECIHGCDNMIFNHFSYFYVCLFLQPSLTVRSAVVTAALPEGLSEVFEGQEEQHHFTFLIFDWNNIQEAPKRISWGFFFLEKKSKSASTSI